MELTNFTIVVFFLFLPGIICKLLLQRLVYVEKRSSFFFIVNAFVLAFLCYSLYGIILYIKNRYFNPSVDFKLDFLLPIFKPDFLTLDGGVSGKELLSILEDIIFVSLLSIPIAFVLSLVSNRKYFNRFGQFIKVTKRFGDEDVWSYVHNSPDDIGWVYVRDIKNNLVYYGWVSIFSETVKNSELFLTKVKVCENSSGDILYEVPAIYLFKNNDEIIIEFPDFKLRGNQKTFVKRLFICYKWKNRKIKRFIGGLSNV